MKEDRLYIKELHDLSQSTGASSWHELTVDWYQQELPVKVSYSLELDEHSLRFSARCFATPDCDETLSPGDFIEGLWQRDVAELFIKDDTSSAYQEFNLSPTAAWWSGLFSEYRKQDTENFKMPDVTTRSDREANTWTASLTIPRAELLVNCSFSEASRVNVCFIFGTKEPRTYVSAGIPDSGLPDYHRTEIFPTLLRES